MKNLRKIWMFFVLALFGSLFTLSISACGEGSLEAVNDSDLLMMERVGNLSFDDFKNIVCGRDSACIKKLNADSNLYVDSILTDSAKTDSLLRDSSLVDSLFKSSSSQAPASSASKDTLTSSSAAEAPDTKPSSSSSDSLISSSSLDSLVSSSSAEIVSSSSTIISGVCRAVVSGDFVYTGDTVIWIYEGDLGSITDGTYSWKFAGFATPHTDPLTGENLDQISVEYSTAGEKSATLTIDSVKIDCEPITILQPLSSSSIEPESSSSEEPESSSSALPVDGTCSVVSTKDSLYIGEEFTWVYVPAVGSRTSGEFSWTFTGRCTATTESSGADILEVSVSCATNGAKNATLTFDEVEIPCSPVEVHALPESSSSTIVIYSSDSDEIEGNSSSSTPKSSSSDNCSIIIVNGSPQLICSSSSTAAPSSSSKEPESSSSVVAPSSSSKEPESSSSVVAPSSSSKEPESSSSVVAPSSSSKEPESSSSVVVPSSSSKEPESSSSVVVPSSSSKEPESSSSVVAPSSSSKEPESSSSVVAPSSSSKEPESSSSVITPPVAESSSSEPEESSSSVAESVVTAPNINPNLPNGQTGIKEIVDNGDGTISVSYSYEWDNGTLKIIDNGDGTYNLDLSRCSNPYMIRQNILNDWTEGKTEFSITPTIKENFATYLGLYLK